MAVAVRKLGASMDGPAIPMVAIAKRRIGLARRAGLQVLTCPFASPERKRPPLNIEIEGLPEILNAG